MEAALSAELNALLRRLSVRTGQFTLASGQTSDFYVDVRQTALHPRGARLLGTALLAEIRRNDAGAIAVAGVELGGVPLCTAVCLASSEDGGLPLPGLVVRKKAKSYGTAAQVEGLANVPDPGPVVLVEDTVTTGGSAVRALDSLRAAGLDPIALIAVVDREEGGAEAIEAAGVQFRALFTKSDLVR